MIELPVFVTVGLQESKDVFFGPHNLCHCTNGKLCSRIPTYAEVTSLRQERRNSKKEKKRAKKNYDQNPNVPMFQNTHNHDGMNKILP